MKKRKILMIITSTPILTASENNSAAKCNKLINIMKIPPMNEKQLLMNPEPPSNDEYSCTSNDE